MLESDEVDAHVNFITLFRRHPLRSTGDFKGVLDHGDYDGDNEQ